MSALTPKMPRNLMFSLWMLGFPLLMLIPELVDSPARLSNNTSNVAGPVIAIVVWLAAAYILYEKKP